MKEVKILNIDDTNYEISDEFARASIGSLDSLETTSKTTVVDAINELKKSVADGKASLASALSEAGVTTANDASFSTIEANIGTMAINKFNDGVNDVKENPGNYGFSESMIAKIGSDVTSVNVKTWCDNNPGYNIDYTKLTSNDFIIMNKTNTSAQTGDSSFYVYVDGDLGKGECSLKSTASDVPVYSTSDYVVKPTNTSTQFYAQVKSGSSGDVKKRYLTVTYTAYDFYIVYDSTKLKS